MERTKVKDKGIGLRKPEKKVSFIDEKYLTEQISQLTSLKDRQMNRSFRRNCLSS